jgi:outer membrane protein TolC
MTMTPNRHQILCKISALAIPILLATGFLPASGGTIPLRMRDIGQQAVLNHPDLRTARFAPAIATSDLDKSKAIYDPILGALMQFEGDDSKSSPSSPYVLSSRTWTSNLSLSSLLQSGATASAEVASKWNRLDGGVTTTDSSTPSVSVSVSQPLLRNLGKEMTERGITTASYSMKMAEADWHARMLGVLAKACTQYLDILKARESLESRKASVETARRLHAENDARVKAGVLAPIDLLDSELGVATREVDLLTAEKAVRDAEDALRYQIHASDNDVFVVSDPLPEPDAPYVPADPLGTALSRRPEIAKARLAVQSEEFNVSVARNQMLPDLAMKGTAGLSGMGADTGRGISDVAEARYPFWSLGVELSFPIRNVAARADFQAGRLRAGQARSTLAGLEQIVHLEVNNAVRTLDTRYRQIAVARKGVQVGEARLASFVKRNALGMATTRNVLDAEADLTAARESLTLAKADYQAALVEIWRATGELPDREGITVSVNDINERAWREIK